MGFDRFGLWTVMETNPRFVPALHLRALLSPALLTESDSCWPVRLQVFELPAGLRSEEPDRGGISVADDL
jgi:hypothetical protein